MPATNPPSEDQVVLYTDGACSGNPGPGGWAYILRHPASGSTKTASGGEPATTNNRMELRSVIEGLSVLKSPCQVRVVTDSRYVADGLRSWMASWKQRGWRKADNRPVLNIELWQELDRLSALHRLTLEWIRGHAGHPENEACDRLAVAAIDQLRSR